MPIPNGGLALKTCTLPVPFSCGVRHPRLLLDPLINQPGKGRPIDQEAPTYEGGGRLGGNGFLNRFTLAFEHGHFSRISRAASRHSVTWIAEVRTRTDILYFMRLRLGLVEEDNDSIVDGVREYRSEEEARPLKADRGGDAETKNGNDRDRGMDEGEENRAAENG
jgi:hypothetical protein